jgi:hypothetical protein
MDHQQNKNNIMASRIEKGSSSSLNEEFHTLSNKWSLYAHLPHDTDWSLNSYKVIMTFNSVEEAIAVTETLPDILVRNCMLFLMRENIKPMWEDEKNRNGGCFSYKVSNKDVYRSWKELSYVTVGNSISSLPNFVTKVTGITISPKKNFCIIKIWMADCTNQNPAVVTNDVKGIVPQGCIFKKHAPEY